MTVTLYTSCSIELYEFDLLFLKKSVCLVNPISNGFDEKKIVRFYGSKITPPASDVFIVYARKIMLNDYYYGEVLMMLIVITCLLLFSMANKRKSKKEEKLSNCYEILIVILQK